MANGDSTVQYRYIPDYPGYCIGNDGSVWSCWTHSHAGTKIGKRWKRLQPGRQPKGYLYINLTRPGRGAKTLRVHRLVLLAFVGPCPEGMECRHLNGIPDDNRLANLVWGTQPENRQDNRRLGTYANGENHSQVKLCEADVRAILARYTAGETRQTLAKEFGVTWSNVHAITTRRSWRHLS